MVFSSQRLEQNRGNQVIQQIIINKVGQYSIKELEKLSGIKAHTIRIWEKRYRIVNPSRTNTNIRFYTDEDLKKIINVSVLNNHGIKISKIAQLSPVQLASEVSSLSAAKTDADIHIDQLMVSMIDLDEEAFEKGLAGLILRFGFENTITDIVYPFLEKIGVLWQTGNITPAQEHFISNLLRQKIIVAIDALPLAPKGTPGVLLFLPEDELHELGLLFYYYIVKKAGFRTYYLGQMVPYQDVLSICARHDPRIMITAITTSPTSVGVREYLNRLCKDRPHSRVLVSGQALKKNPIQGPANLKLFFTAGELKTLLRSFK